MYRARGSSLYLMTGMRDITMCASELTFHRLASFLLKSIFPVPVPGYVLLENSIHYAILTSPLHRVNSATTYTNISISEI